jgi:integrase
MAEDDIYGSKKQFERFVKNIENLTKKPKKNKRRFYYVKNKENLTYFRKLCNTFASKDLSYIRRVRLFQVLKVICYATEKNLKNCERDDINEIVAFMHTRYKTYESKRDFIKDIKCIWKVLFPETDIKGRADETLTPYVVRHLSRSIDKSKQKRRNEKYTIEEFEKILRYFDNAPKIQAYITAIQETYTRPQELCYLKIRDFEFFDSYGIAHVSEHGKEGTKTIQFETLSYPFILKWFKAHPKRKDPNAFFFIVESNNGKYSQMTNHTVNMRLKKACRDLGIDKQITCYSLKRMGITIDRMNGVPDKIIMAKAGWTSTKQLQVYDLGTRDEALRMSLIRKGLVNAETPNEKKFEPKQRVCEYCKFVNGFSEEICNGCFRPLIREKIQEIHDTHKRVSQHAIMHKLNKMEKFCESLGSRNNLQQSIEHMENY